MAINVSLFGDETLHVPAWKFYIDPSPICLAIAGRRGAKTYTGAKKFWKKVWEEDWPRCQGKPYEPGAARRGKAEWWDRRPRLHYWVVADTYQLLDEPKRYLLQFLPPQLLDHIDNSKGKWWLKGDILVEFKTVHDPKGKVGSGLDGMWIEEAARVRPDAWGLYLQPALADKDGWLIATTTPLGRDWTYTHIQKHAEDGVPGYGAHQWKTIDNNRVPSLKARVELARATLPPEYFEREYEASRQAFIGQIYKAFKRAKNMVTKLPDGIRFARIVGGCDWGTHGALTVCGMTYGERPHYYFVDEDCQDNLLVEDYWAPKAIEFQRKWKFNQWVCDPAEPDNLTRFRNAGINASKHKNYGAGTFDEHGRSVLSGIRTMSSVIHQGRLHVLSHCENLLDEFENYKWQEAPANAQSASEDGTTVYSDKPKPHQKDHAVTTARYIISSVEKGPMMRELGVAA